MRVTLAALVAALLAACAGGGDDAGEPWYEEGARARGLDFTWESGHDGEHYLMPEIMGGGAALFDMDDDGDLDAYLVQGGSLTGGGGPNRLFENTGGGRFRDASTGSGADERGYGMGVACGDADGDGSTDVYVTNVGPNALLLNDGAGRFRAGDPNVAHPGWGVSAAFADLDADGDLDLFVVNYLEWSAQGELPCRNAAGGPDYCSPQTYESPAVDALFENGGDGTFADVTVPSGVAGIARTGLGIAPLDYDADGLTDLFVANDGMPDSLWQNRGGLRFEDVGARAGCSVDIDGRSKAGMGVAVADVDDDGDPDLLVCNLHRQSDSFYENAGGSFVDRTARMGLAIAPRPFTRFGIGWVDFDHDGVLDLYEANGRVTRHSTTTGADPFAEPNLVFRGTAGGALAELLPRGGTREPLVATSRAAAFGDVDGDGGVDVLVANRDGPTHLLLNRVPERGGWIVIDPRARSGAPALGATVTLAVGARRVTRDVRAASSYLASNDPRVPRRPRRRAARPRGASPLGGRSGRGVRRARGWPGARSAPRRGAVGRGPKKPGPGRHHRRAAAGPLGGGWGPGGP